MKKQFHILNGDALKEQLPVDIMGERIVARECLVDGNVEGSDLEELYRTRAQFISENYEGFTSKDYYDTTVSEFEKIQNIEAESDINLWFEDDLFCQVNFWFVNSLIYDNNKNQFVYLVRPKDGCEYSFGAMNTGELLTSFANRTKLKASEIKELGNLWKLYQQNDYERMIGIAERLKERFPFLIPAIEAHKDRFPQNGNLGRPVQTLIQIMEELNTTEFDPIFRSFCKRETIYGFGDLQVKRILEEVENKRNTN